MRRLCILRHAKSSWKNPDWADDERPLKKRGRRDAPRMGRFVANHFAPMQIYVSPACRAQQTFDGLMKGWSGLSTRHRVTDPALYTFAARDLMTWLSQRSDNEETVCLIGHNPALTDLINGLVGTHALDNLPTAGWCELHLPVTTWRELVSEPLNARIHCLQRPRDLPHGE